MDCASQTDSYLEFEFRFHSVDRYEPARSCIYRNRLSFSFQGKVILDKGKAFGKKGVNCKTLHMMISQQTQSLYFIVDCH